MRRKRAITDNKGFSLVELIVIIAIMALMVGMGTLAVSLLTGSEAKQACEKISAQLNEAKTGSMSRYDEDMNIVYVDDPSAYDWADKEGYYVVKQLYTFTKDATTKKPVVMSLGSEHRYICNSRVSMVFTYDGGNYSVSPVSGNGVGFTFDRATGLYKDVRTGCGLDGSGDVIFTTVDAQPVSLEMTSGLRTYKINFISETGKHTIEK
ncbi:MAG: type II secretion system protein [Lachnospiraceae bacterium]|nr:type II secretion system protein [Lachnospiraceae bacterium]